jgi:hypothetical protein
MALSKIHFTPTKINLSNTMTAAAVEGHIQYWTQEILPMNSLPYTETPPQPDPEPTPDEPTPEPTPTEEPTPEPTPEPAIP